MRSWSTWPLSAAAHLAALAVIVVAPLAADGELPTPAPLRAVHYTAMKAVPVPEIPARSAVPPPTLARRPVPLQAPSTIAPEREVPPPDPATMADSALPMTRSGVGDAPALGVSVTAPVPPPAMRPPATVRAGTGVQVPRKLVDARPVYPDLARAARVEGTVVIDAVLGLDGRIEHMQLVRSVPLLDRAALDAVRQWRYTPTRLNGEPVRVMITIFVRFTLR